MVVVVVTDPGALLVASCGVEHNDGKCNLRGKLIDNSFKLMLIVVV
jgi:hypothetical protein